MRFKISALFAVCLVLFFTRVAVAQDAMPTPDTGDTGHIHASDTKPASHGDEQPAMSDDGGMSMMHMMMGTKSHFPTVATAANADTLISGPVTHGFYLAPEVKYAQIAGKNSVLLGGRIAWLMNHHFSIGAAGYGMVNRIRAPIKFETAGGDRIYRSLGYGGLFLGYVIAPLKVVHAEIDVLVGGGGSGMMHSYMGMGAYPNGAYGNRDYGTVRFFVVEPEAHVELNISHYVRLAVGGGYRVVSGVNGLGLSNRDIQGPSGSLLVKVGIL